MAKVQRVVYCNIKSFFMMYSSSIFLYEKLKIVDYWLINGTFYFDNEIKILILFIYLKKVDVNSNKSEDKN